MLSRLLYVLCICTYSISCLVEPQLPEILSCIAYTKSIIDESYSKISVFFVNCNNVVHMANGGLQCKDASKSHDHLLTDPAVHDGQATASLLRTHTRPHPLIQRAADLPPPSSSQALVRRVVFGTLKVHSDDHPDGVSVGVHITVVLFPIRPFGHYFTPPYSSFPMSRKCPPL